VKATPDDCDFDNIPGLCSGEQCIEAEDSLSRKSSLSAKTVTVKILPTYITFKSKRDEEI
jgi:hypothetical protein